jgi:predicted component of type VI protein secretion system
MDVRFGDRVRGSGGSARTVDRVAQPVNLRLQDSKLSWVYDADVLPFLIGRKTPHLTLPEDPDAKSIVSREHARIDWDYARCCYTLTILGRNGVYLNGRRFFPDDSPIALADGDPLQIGDHCFWFLLPDDDDGPAAATAPAAASAAHMAPTVSSLLFSQGSQSQPAQQQPRAASPDGTKYSAQELAVGVAKVVEALAPGEEISYAEAVEAVVARFPGAKKSSVQNILERYNFVTKDPNRRKGRSFVLFLVPGATSAALQSGAFPLTIKKPATANPTTTSDQQN